MGGQGFEPGGRESGAEAHAVQALREVRGRRWGRSVWTVRMTAGFEGGGDGTWPFVMLRAGGMGGLMAPGAGESGAKANRSPNAARGLETYVRKLQAQSLCVSLRDRD